MSDTAKKQDLAFEREHVEGNEELQEGLEWSHRQVEETQVACCL